MPAQTRPAGGSAHNRAGFDQLFNQAFPQSLEVYSLRCRKTITRTPWPLSGLLGCLPRPGYPRSGRWCTNRSPPGRSSRRPLRRWCGYSPAGGEGHRRPDLAQIDSVFGLILGVGIRRIHLVRFGGVLLNIGKCLLIHQENTVFAPASIAMLAMVKRESMERWAKPSPTNSMDLYKAPSTLIMPIICKMMSLPLTHAPGLPARINLMAAGTLNQALPVAMAAAMSVLPIPVEKLPKRRTCRCGSRRR